jgi:hypothetical protein
MNPSPRRGVRSLARSDNGHCFFAGISSIIASVSRPEGCVRRRREASRCAARTADVSGMCPRVLQTDNNKCPFAGTFKEPSGGLEPPTPSLPWRFPGVARVHARSRPTEFRLEIRPFPAVRMRRETSRVSFLMCPFCVRASSSHLTTPSAAGKGSTSLKLRGWLTRRRRDEDESVFMDAGDCARQHKISGTVRERVDPARKPLRLLIPLRLTPKA